MVSARRPHFHHTNRYDGASMLLKDHLLSRREALAFCGTTAALWLMGGCLKPERAAANPRGLSCVVRPEQTEGPYFVDERLHRSDIRSDPADGQIRPGTQLALTLQVFRIGAGDCQPLPGTQVDIWHCDALGVYSDVRDPSFQYHRPEKFFPGKASKSPTHSARPGSLRCTPVGMPAGQCTFISRFGLLRELGAALISRRKCISMMD